MIGLPTIGTVVQWRYQLYASVESSRIFENGRKYRYVLLRASMVLLN